MPGFGRILDLDRTLRILAYVREPLSERTEPIAALADEPLADGLYRYVAVHGGVRVYRVDDEITEVRRISLPELTWPRGIAANAVSGLLHVPFWGDSRAKHGGRQFGYVACFELATGRLRWVRQYEPSIDSLAVTPDGRKAYMPSGEERSDGGWIVFDADSGDELSRIDSPPGAHNTIVGPDGTRVYLASLAHDFILVADTSSDDIVMRIGPFGNNVRPFAINGRGTLAAVNVDFLSGFEIADLGTGRVLHRVQVEGHPWVDPPLPATQSHGVTFSADEGEIWVVDAYNRMVHVFDATGLPERAPVQVASIDVADADAPASQPKWIAASRDGRLVHVSTGHILDARTHAVVGRVAPSRYFVEVHWENGRPAEAYSRYGLGYRRGTDRSTPGQR
jgi:DNA-binding beta-propeller fold protein YncE